MSEMVERVAEAIRKDDGNACLWRGRKCILVEGCICVSLARAAIGAMREPTEAMLEAGPVEPYMDRDVWASMIDAALK